MILISSPPAGDETQRNAGKALHIWGGELLLGLAAIILLGAGVAQLVKATRASFLDHLDRDAAKHRWIAAVGRIGYGARGIIFLAIGYMLARSGLDRSAAEAGNLGNAMDWFSTPVRQLVAVGLLVFGVFSIIEAAYRPIRNPPAKQAERKAKRKVKRAVKRKAAA